ncbi:50S ribosomal protein L6 [Candidatus Pantoea carbekii]|uniref:Large ribosomal subunit protein uL6 n=1 Tax=Candidatus Pantoea carbekii TaxID=1235990 RepID=U3U5T3_9GAMM|nr:50S ribosomal protein L6 [Candidatus Pantoea carbekii]AKC32487.1 50S ribosomal protein L6 [Candidatus Pantoea carbekii]BAO00215.1 50S ribosomal protein L6 [Candidatus Pantoea carbekii]
MSRIAKAPVIIPVGVELRINGQEIFVKGENGQLNYIVNNAVEFNFTKNTLRFFPRQGYLDGWAQAGTARALLNNIIIGVTQGFIRHLQLVGIGYRASIEGNSLSMFLGFSHPIVYILPKDILAQCPTQTEIILKGADKQLIGQVAAELRAYLPPEPYKGKGIRYTDEVIRTKEAKKK